jgi:hypothetical protein
MNNDAPQPLTDNESIIAYFKASLMICSFQKHAIEQNSPILESFETMLLDMPEELICSKNIMTFCGKVFRSAIKWNIFPIYTMAAIVDEWSREDWDAFEFFLTDVDFSFNEEFVEFLKDLILVTISVITGYGYTIIPT